MAKPTLSPYWYAAALILAALIAAAAFMRREREYQAPTGRVPINSAELIPFYQKAQQFQRQDPAPNDAHRTLLDNRSAEIQVQP